MRIRPHHIADTLNRIDIRLLIFAVLFLNTFSLMLGENEEEYFAFAKAFMNHDWIPGALSVRDIPGTRIIFDSVIGYALRFASFEEVAMFGRALCALLFAFPLARIFNKLRFRNLESIFLLQVICVLSHQSFFGDEWIFGSFETKTIAYVFVFYSLFYLLDNRYFLSILFSGFAVYFHILVGGWYALILFVHLLISRTALKTILIYGLTFAALTAPIGIYLARSYLLDNPNIINGILVSQVYVFFRNPHHLDMIKNLSRWGSSTQSGVILSLLSWVFCLRLYSSSGDLIVRKLALFNILLFGQQFISLFIALFDKTGVFLKFYPYRTSSLSFFLMAMLLILFFKDLNLRRTQQSGRQIPVIIPAGNPSTVIVSLMIGCITAGLCINLYKNINNSYKLLCPSSEESARMSLYGWIKQHTPKDTVFIDANPHNRGDLDFIRRTDRDLFSVYKFVPTTNKLIYDWYQRVQENYRVKEDIAYVYKLREKYRINFIVSKTSLADNGFQLVYHNDYYFLYSF